MTKQLRGMALGLIIALSALALSFAPTYAHGNNGDHGGSGNNGDHGGSGNNGDDGDEHAPAREVLVAFLTGGAEVNSAGQPNQGDLDGSAIARVRLVPAKGRVCINAETRSLDPLVLAHIHSAPAGANGPVVVDFTGLIDGPVVKGCVSADPSLIDAIVANPASYYLNIHSETFRAGAVRGQLEPRGSLRSSFQLTLSGAAEVGNPGDLDGIGSARVTLAARELEICINARVRKLAPLTLAHIHNAPAGANGPVVVDFTQFIDGSRVNGCVTVDPNLLQAIRANPASYYVNVHTAEFPAGAMRGQLQ